VGARQIEYVVAIRCDKCNSSVLQYEWQDALDDCNRRAYFGVIPLLCCCRGLARGLLLCLLCTHPAPATHLVEITAVVTHHLEAVVWNVLRDGDEDWSDEITRAEYLKVALNLRHHSRGIVGGLKKAQDIWNGLKMPIKS